MLKVGLFRSLPRMSLPADFCLVFSHLLQGLLDLSTVKVRLLETHHPSLKTLDRHPFLINNLAVAPTADPTSGRMSNLQAIEDLKVR